MNVNNMVPASETTSVIGNPPSVTKNLSYYFLLDIQYECKIENNLHNMTFLGTKWWHSARE